MSGVKVTNERPPRPVTDAESVDPDVDDENYDWEPDVTTQIPPGEDPGDVLTWDGDSWEPAPPSGSVSIALDDLTDVTLTSPAVGDRLRFDGSVWRNSALRWSPVTVNAPNVVTTDGLALYVPWTTDDGDPIMMEVP